MAIAPTRAANFTGEQTADRLADFRGGDQPRDDIMPQPFSETADPAPAPPGNDNPAADPAPQPKPEDAPQMRVDPRDAIARRARERRMDEESRIREEMGDDLTGLPPELARNDEPDPAPQPAPAANPNPPQPRADDPPQPRTYNLKVNRNDFEVSRDDLIRYAGLTEEEATGIPDISLVRAAQLNLAAEDRLASAKHASQSARFAAPGAPPYQAEDQRHVPEQHEQQRQPAPLDLRSAVQKIQLGDEDEAAEALLQVVSTVTGQHSANQQIEQAKASVGQAIGQDLERFARENPDIVNDSVLSAAHRTLMVEHAIGEIARIPGVPQDRVAMLRNNPQLALQAYQAALVDGYQVRPPAEIFAAAGQQVRQRFGASPQQHADPGSDPRSREAKRGLIQQPARIDNARAPAQPQPTGRRSPSDVIRDMRRARHQDVV